MKTLLTIFLLLAGHPLLHAAWSFGTAERLSAPPGLEFMRRPAAQNGQTAELHAVLFRVKTHTFAVMDDPDGIYDTARAAKKRGALAAVNGGYFHPDRTPLGLVIRQGVKLHPYERSQLLSGILAVSGDRITISRAAAFKLTPATREALQAGPFLTEAGKPVPGLNNLRSAARTVVFADDAGRHGVLICKFATLAEMAEILATPGVLAGGKIMRALNLDGGSSTALWVQGQPAFYERERKAVRNYLAVVPR